MTGKLNATGKEFEDIVVYSAGEAIVIGHVVHSRRGQKGWHAETPDGKLIDKGCTYLEACGAVRRWSYAHQGVFALNGWGWV